MKRVRRYACFFPCLALFIQSSLKADNEHAFSQQWPEQWVDTYERFENFIRLKRSTWPETNLEFSESGEFTHTFYLIGIDVARRSPLTLEINELGETGSGWSLGRNLGQKTNLNSRKWWLNPGIYGAQVKSRGTLGYQYHRPIVWFEIKDLGMNASDPKQLVYSDPGFDPDDDQRLPNYRLSDFRDFHVYTASRNPMTIGKENQLIMPSIQLGLSVGGIVGSLSLEKLEEMPPLVWMVYKNNILIDRIELSEPYLQIKGGVGSYLVFLCVNGSSGWMPVSNLLSFPLFESDEIEPTPFPPDADKDRVPDVIESLIEKKNSGEVLSFTEEQFLQVWDNWGYDLRSNDLINPELNELIKRVKAAK